MMCLKFERRHAAIDLRQAAIYLEVRSKSLFFSISQQIFFDQLSGDFFVKPKASKRRRSTKKKKRFY